LGNVQPRNRRFAPWMILPALAAGLGILPLGLNPYALIVLTFAYIYAAAAASWDLLAGYAGQLSFGQVAFFGIGGYTVALLAYHFPYWYWLSNPISATVIGILASVVFSVFIGASSVRMRGPYFAAVTFISVIVLQQIVIIFGDCGAQSVALPTRFDWAHKYCTGGQFGLMLPSYGAALFGDNRLTYWASLLYMIVSLASMMLVVRSRYGLYFKCIRDDEIAAQAIGINLTKYKLIAFAISAVFCSVAGSWYVLATGMVNTDMFGYGYNFLWIEMVVIGGMTTIIGTIPGALFVGIVSELLRANAAIALAVFAAIFVIVVRFLPEGILPLLRRKIGLR